jgi:hypothetical protein
LNAPLFSEHIHAHGGHLEAMLEGTAIIRGASEAVAAAAALELIFKQRLKSANVVPAVKPALLRAPRINPIPIHFGN